MKASGTFEVQLQPAETHATGAGGVQLGHMTLDKSFNGDLEAVSKGQMLSATSSEEGSAGYVAIEQVVGKLNGKIGSFALMHFGTMNRGADQLILEVVPDSGAGELIGMRGEMTIKIADGSHHFEMEYALND